jgi:fatty acid desaturase
MKTPSWRDTRVLDEFFIKGRNMWPDLKDVRHLPYRRELVPDEVVRFIRSTALNEHGIVHYVRGYLRAYGDDYKLGIWAAMWGGEEYLHSIVLRTIYDGLGERFTDAEIRGLETGDYATSYDNYLEEKRKGYRMDARLQQLIYGVIQEYAAKIAYSSVADVAGDDNVAALLRRVAKDEMRHCRFFQLCLEALAENLTEEERAEIFPQFTALFKDHQMPQEHIPMFREFDMGTDLYIKFWTPEYRSNLILYLTEFFRRFRQPGQAAVAAADHREADAAQPAPPLA